MVLYGIVAVSLMLNYLTEVSQTPVMGGTPALPTTRHPHELGQEGKGA
jgi:hypothetical protein